MKQNCLLGVLVSLSVTVPVPGSVCGMGCAEGGSGWSSNSVLIGRRLDENEAKFSFDVTLEGTGREGVGEEMQVGSPQARFGPTLGSLCLCRPPEGMGKRGDCLASGDPKKQQFLLPCTCLFLSVGVSVYRAHPYMSAPAPCHTELIIPLIFPRMIPWGCCRAALGC